MPLHRTNHLDAPKLVEKLEKEGEVVTAISSDDSGVYIATKPSGQVTASARRRPAGEKETRA